jgi:hypothetical protein
LCSNTMRERDMQRMERWRKHGKRRSMYETLSYNKGKKQRIERWTGNTNRDRQVREWLNLAVLTSWKWKNSQFCLVKLGCLKPWTKSFINYKVKLRSAITKNSIIIITKTSSLFFFNETNMIVIKSMYHRCCLVIMNVYVGAKMKDGILLLIRPLATLRRLLLTLIRWYEHILRWLGSHFNFFF